MNIHCRTFVPIVSLLFVSLSAHVNAINYDEMISIPATKFQMGCDPEIDPICKLVPEEKQHEVSVSAFKIDKYEVTTKDYGDCVAAGICEYPTMGGLMHFGNEEADLFPINGVSWYDAKTYCETFKGKRLPTSAEWELAARGTDKRIYPWGNDEPDCTRAVIDRPGAGFLGCGTGDSMNVGSKPKGASPYGVMDMAGNVWEWTSDWYDENYYANSPAKDPKGPSRGTLKITRGGDFLSRRGYEVRSTGLFPYYPTNPSPAIGFRCAQ
ncbi:formylglycine-generating enzyme family protein [Parendozoicomonas haliclonae]|uniref:Serine/threonine-protein kinase pkn1 n=1 Tax=Parendozoicomonas haliclonae TaxID=1960125 RepID=A0A1X7APA7_9GAMM|nr:SUMF1/EgtB/PvdO family nonheme iron enzyme [Parendozoicomonas haliclonae]SMA49919.1 Serine/threonine-protein kinase pkn1 [Parendozoicomonas haliclonae]